MTDPFEKVAAMRRLVVYYKETGQIYVECLLLGNDTAIAVFRDSDFPAYMQFHGNDDDTAGTYLIEFLGSRPEFPDLEYQILDDDTAYYDPRAHKFYNANWEPNRGKR